MKNYFYLVALILPTIMCNAQPDSVIITELLPTDSLYKPRPYRGIIHNFYNGEKNVIVKKEGEDFYKYAISDSGVILTKTRIEFFFTHDSSYYMGLTLRDTLLPDIVVTHSWREFEMGEHQEFYSTGEVKVFGKFSWGYKEGKWVFYDRNGVVIKEEEWYSGILQE
jgi:antitoxin component YwqK of YwqJK toxin-antitoxin module